MAVQTRAIKRRIKSVKNTRKITKAMELVAASKMRRAVQSVLGTRPFSKLAWETVRTIGQVTDTSLHPMLREGSARKKILLVLIASDRGLAGGFNVNILKRTFAELKTFSNDAQVDTICIGKRGVDAMRRANRPVIATFTDIANNPRFESILPVGRMVIHEYMNGTYDTVLVAYTDFVSAITQRPIILELLPLGKPEAPEGAELVKANEYKFEPDPKTVLERLLPRLVETMIYQAVLESTASEHSARMMAMRNASDAAGEMIDSLTFAFNQARQAGITQEIAEISSGKAALESK